MVHTQGVPQVSPQADNIHLHDEFKLGKQDHESDHRTIMFSDFVASDIQVPVSWNFDSRRAKFPLHMWGNDDYGDCVLAAQANGTVRNERVETGRTPKITDEDVVARYKAMTGCQSPGDAHDNGLVMLEALRNWRAGWSVGNKTYQIAAFGQVNHSDAASLRRCCYLFNGLQLGFNLPMNAQQGTHNGLWDSVPGAGSQPGSWGGHAVYCKRFDADSIYVLTWGREVRVTNSFINNYCDEAWSVIDNLDPWRTTHGVLNVQAMLDKMKQSGIAINA